jgi:hypothetical protein
MEHTCKTKISCSQGVCEYIADEKTTDKCCPETAFKDDQSCQNDSNQEKCILECQEPPHQPQPSPPSPPTQNSHHKVAVHENKVVVENTDGSNQKTLVSVTPSSVMLNTSGVSGDANSVTPVNLSHLLRSNGWGTASDFPSSQIPVKFCDSSCKCKVGQCGDSMLLVGLSVGVPLLLVIIGMAIGMRRGKNGKGKK